MVDVSNKKRKLEVNGSAKSLAKQPSFSDVLEQLEAEEDSAGSELASMFNGTHVVMDNCRSHRDLECMAKACCSPVRPENNLYR